MWRKGRGGGFEARLRVVTPSDPVFRDPFPGARPLGAEERCLGVGPWTLTLEGLDPRLAGEVGRRFGGFLGELRGGSPSARVAVVRDSPEGYVEGWEAGGPYRIETVRGEGGLRVRSYHFALAPASEGRWVLGLARGAGRREPLGRAVENALRYLVARLAVEDGGLALHAASVERDGLAYVLAGPSGSGKTTAVGLLARAGRSLGDDLAVILPGEPGFLVPAVPFDNSERAPADPPREAFPLAGIFRLVKSRAAAVERPPLPLAIASLLACAAFPWAMPDLVERVAQQAEGLAARARFVHLHFALDSDLWPLLRAGGG